MRFHNNSPLVALLLLVASVSFAEIPSRPEQLSFPELSFDMPDAQSLRFELANGIPVYAKSDTQLPLVNVSVLFRGGRYLLPPGKEGLSAIASEVWRTGGAGELSAQQLDEELDFLAASISTGVGDISGAVSLNVMTKDLDTAMAMLMDVITKPRFQTDRFAKAKDDLVQAMKRRNDDTSGIEGREWPRLIYGVDFWMNRLATKQSVASITADDCREFVTSLVKAGNVIVAVAGEFSIESITATLNSSIGQLPELEREIPPVPSPTFDAKPGVYFVHKEDVNQARVRLGHIGVKLGHPDEFALRVGNDILGGGGFTSRITKKVRSDEGLAYSAGSSISFPVTIPGVFAAGFQTKSSTAAYASKLTVDLITQILEGEVSQEELNTARNSFTETFPRRFESAAQTVGLFARDELLKRPDDYWTSYRERITKVDAKGVREALARNLKPNQLVFLVVGNIDEIKEGHPDHEVQIGDFGELTEIPLRDPLTLEPLPRLAEANQE
ncbi:MAG: insulinase family protein [bacterium]|nr:insulinase family protein [bacterium]